MVEQFQKLFLLMLTSLGAECEQGSQESQGSWGSRGRGVPVFPRREVGQFELVQLLQELLEADENKLGNSALQNKRWRKLVLGNCQI